MITNDNDWIVLKIYDDNGFEFGKIHIKDIFEIFVLEKYLLLA